VKAKRKVTVTPAKARAMLGRRRYFSEVRRRLKEPGVATGLAWTPVGGDVLFVEATAYVGTGRLIITGQLGDVMKESAQAALSFVRANAARLQKDLAEDYFQTHDLHIHVPAGAIPKDGPSAGVTMATALASLIAGRKVREDTAMTGELTLTGQVLPIGGLKEKALAAQDAGLERVIAPKLNEPEVEDFPKHLLEDIEFIWVDRIDQVLAQALEPEAGARNGARPTGEARRRPAVSRDGTATRRARAAQTARKPTRPKARSK
jgi:ATP-dependent Lon protease